jgi:hypothetical protein
MKRLAIPFLLFLFAASSAIACDADLAQTTYRDPAVGDINDFALMLRSAKTSSCAPVAATKLLAKVRAMNNAGAWNTAPWIGGALSIALATGLELGAQGQLSAELDDELRKAAKDYLRILQSNPPCGFSSGKWTNGNTCAEDYALAAAAHGWRAAYLRLTGRDWRHARTPMLGSMRSMLSDSASCIRKNNSIVLDPSRGICNGTLADLQASPPTGYLLSINKHAETPSYGIGQMVHLSAGFNGLDVACEKVLSTEIGAEEKTIAQHFFREGVDKSAQGDLTSAQWRTQYDSSPCLRMNASSSDIDMDAQGNPLPHTCRDEENDLAFLDSKIGDTPYRPDMFAVRDFYLKYGFPVWVGTGPTWWDFDDDFQADDNLKFRDVFLDDASSFWGPGRREMYWTMAVEWLTASKRPAMAGRPYYHGGIKRSSYFIESSGTGAPSATGLYRDPLTLSSTHLTIHDLNQGLLKNNDPVAVQNVDNKFWYATGGGGSSILASASSISSNTTWTILKICNTSPCSVSGPIAHGDEFTLRAPDGTHYVTATLNGPVTAAATTVGTTETLKLDRTMDDK